GRRRHTISTRDWSSDVCSSDLTTAVRSPVDFDLSPEETKKGLAAWEIEHAPLAAALAKFEKEELPGRFEAWAAGKPWEQATPAGERKSVGEGEGVGECGRGGAW